MRTKGLGSTIASVFTASAGPSVLCLRAWAVEALRDDHGFFAGTFGHYAISFEKVDRQVVHPVYNHDVPVNWDIIGQPGVLTVCYLKTTKVCQRDVHMHTLYTYAAVSREREVVW